MAKAPSRFISLQGCFNFRDLGGYRAQDGRSVKWLRLFRSDAIHYATPDDISRLQGELGIFTVVDLRNPEEIQQAGLTTMAGSSVRYHNVPYLGDRQMAPPGPDEDPVARLTDIYQWIIRNAGARIAESLNILAEGGNLPAVFHCTTGKDRAGILAAMVLGVLGVDRDQIMQDYVLTNEIIDELGERLRARPGNEHRTLDSFRAQPKVMEMVLDELADKHGGPAGYLQAHGLADGTIDKLRDALLE